MATVIGPAVLPPPENIITTTTNNNNNNTTTTTNNNNDDSEMDASSPWAISNTLSAQDIARNKRLKAVVKSTPWLDGWEFEQVGRSLVSAARNVPLVSSLGRRRRKRRRRDHSSNYNSQEEEEVEEPLASLYRALDKLSVWKIRMDNRLPHAVESSYQLAQVHARSAAHASLSSSSASLSTSVEELRLAYSCAILRAINGLADALQQQRANAASVAMLCGDLGIPSWLVDIRHEATHNQLPKLSVLRLAATTLLEYFHQAYWQPRFLPTDTSASPQQNKDPSATVDTVPSITDLVQPLLAYKQQQEKFVAKAEAERKATAEATRKGSSSKAKKTAASSKPKPRSLDSSSDDDSEEEMYLDALAGGPTFWSPSSASIGTTSNRFAALQETKSNRNKKRKKAKMTAEEKAEKKKNKEPSSHHHAKQFVKKGMHHLELAYHTALLFLVWGGVGGLEGGALIPITFDDYPETEEGIKKVRQLYGILLVAIGREWPGFLQALMIHLVDSILATENQVATNTKATTTESPAKLSPDPATAASEPTIRRKLFFLESWVQYLVSREFLANFHSDLKPKANNSNNSSSKTKKIRASAPWSFLEQMRYPLNSLCDRLEIMSRDGSTSHQLAAFFCAILGDHRVPYFGVVFEGEDEANSCREEVIGQGGDGMESILPNNAVGDRSEGKPLVTDTTAPSYNTASRSLQEMEGLLSGGTTATADVMEKETKVCGSDKVSPSIEPTAEFQSTTDKTKTPGPRPAWARCSNWEPCAIGALPGHPCSS